MIGYTFDSSKMGELQHSMTLDEWQQQTGHYVGTHPRGAKFVSITVFSKWELFHLTDYVVSSCSAGVYWLVPR